MKTAKQTVNFKAAPHDVYEVLMSSAKHSKFTGSKATVSRRVGGKFSIWTTGHLTLVESQFCAEENKNRNAAKIRTHKCP